MIQKRLVILMVALLFVSGDALAALAAAGCPALPGSEAGSSCCCGPDCPDNAVESGINTRCCGLQGGASSDPEPATTARTVPVPTAGEPAPAPAGIEILEPGAPATPVLAVPTRAPDIPRYQLFCSYLI